MKLNNLHQVPLKLPPQTLSSKPECEKGREDLEEMDAETSTSDNKSRIMAY